MFTDYEYVTGYFNYKQSGAVSVQSSSYYSHWPSG